MYFERGNMTMATEVKSSNRYTSRKVEVDGITLYDSDARFRAST